ANIAPQLLQIHMGLTEKQVTDLVLSDNEGLEPIYEKLNKHLKVVDRSGQTLQDIENYVRMCNDTGFPVDAVFIDYFGYIKRPMRNSSYDEYLEIAREIKQVTKCLNCFMFVLYLTIYECS